MSKIMISELETAESVQDSDWIAIDDGEHTKKIAVEDFEETASSSARSYAEAAAQSASDAEDSADAAGATSAEVTLQINRAVALVGQAEEYATAASTSAGQASTSATTARTQAGIATTKANEAAASAATINDQVEMARSWAVGGTGKRVDEAVNNAKYWAETARAIAGGGVVSFNGRGGIVVPESGDYDSTQISHAKGSSTVSVSTELNAIQSEINSVQGEINDFQDMYEEEIHGVNLLKYPYNNVSRTINGVTFTINSDGSVTANGTATANTIFVLHNQISMDYSLLRGKSFVISGGYGEEHTFVECYMSSPESWYQDKNGKGRTFTFPEVEPPFYNMDIIVHSGTTVNNVKFYPMLRKADIEDSTYRPYNTQSIQHQLDAQGVLGAKNLLPTATASTTSNGVTYTVNADGTVTANGTATADAWFAWDTGLNLNIEIEEVNVPTKNGYTISGCDDPSTSTYYVGLTSANRGYIVVKNGVTVTNKLFYPMLRLASDPDSTYQPYAMTNRELTDNVNAINSEISNVENGSTASQAYTVGEYVIRNKIMRKVISAIARGDALVIGTNLSSSGTTVGEELTELNNSLDNIDVRYTTANGAEWSERGADTWHPFSSQKMLIWYNTYGDYTIHYCKIVDTRTWEVIEDLTPFLPSITYTWIKNDGIDFQSDYVETISGNKIPPSGPNAGANFIFFKLKCPSRCTSGGYSSYVNPTVIDNITPAHTIIGKYYTQERMEILLYD